MKGSESFLVVLIAGCCMLKYHLSQEKVKKYHYFNHNEPNIINWNQHGGQYIGKR